VAGEQVLAVGVEADLAADHGAQRRRDIPSITRRLVPHARLHGTMLVAAAKGQIDAYHSGRHFLQIPGPTNVPGRVLRAIAAPTIDHRGPEFAELAREVIAGAGWLCGTSRPVALYPSSGTGAWEAALVNTLSPGDRVLAFDTGHFATLWSRMAGKLGLEVDLVPGDWRQGVQPGQVLEKLSADPGHQVKAVTVVQNETSTGAASQIPLIRAAIDT